MRQITESVAQITSKAGDEEIRKTRYHDMLKADIREYVSYSTCPALETMISRAREREIDLQYLRKRKVETEQVTGVLGKKPKGSNVRPKGQAGQSCCRKYGRPHKGACRARSSSCYKCVKTEHIGRDFTAPTPMGQLSDLIFFHCN